MALFLPALQKVLDREGRYVNDPDDPGGETYKGIARRINSKWEGWVSVDMAKTRNEFPGNMEKDAGLQQQVEAFYQVNYWDALSGDKIENQLVADSIFDFAVNAGLKTSASLAQMVVESNADGVIGPESLGKINAFDPDHFLASFALAKIARYITIVRKRPESRKYLYGWVCRALE
ncbi:glycoside hydrolase family 108 protein [Microbacter margulisiae]|uniref:Lysozyme family protein n=1 Tax=Microbacter margulisiae TaxID=1350067 RepID=A0A7W5DRQ6_9PORP|nr:glycosyl hydrolase 108 family protein [Microbacter margulisiae]MBB3187840.1 lysozyme family protein [Microbacter margulisiae]